MANRYDAERQSWEQEDSLTKNQRHWDSHELISLQIPVSFLGQVAKAGHTYKNEMLCLVKVEELKTIQSFMSQYLANQ